MSWKTKEFKQGIDTLFRKKPLKDSVLKALEELNELSLVLVQFLTKPDTISVEDITEEIVDVEMNLDLIKKHFSVSNDIRKAKIDKFLQSKNYLKYADT